MIHTDTYCHSGPGNGDNSILTKLSVMPFLSWGGSIALTIPSMYMAYHADLHMIAQEVK